MLPADVDRFTIFCSKEQMTKSIKKYCFFSFFFFKQTSSKKNVSHLEWNCQDKALHEHLHVAAILKLHQCKEHFSEWLLVFKEAENYGVQ